jgi:hypothetical protein
VVRRSPDPLVDKYERCEREAWQKQPPKRDNGASNDEHAQDDQHEKRKQAGVGSPVIAPRPNFKRAIALGQPALIDGADIFFERSAARRRF